MRTPNLFIVGAPKCGTTALHNYLHQHPDVYMAPLKELFFFSSDFAMPESVFPKTLEEYMRCFEGAQSEPVVGESTISYLYSRTAAKNIHDFNPEAKIIMMLRDPVDALHSLHNQLLFNQVEKLARFEDALAATEGRKKRGENEIGQTRWLRYQEIFRYTEQVRRYMKLFPLEQLKVIIYDDFRDDPGEVYGETLAFAGVDPNFEATLDVINARKRMRSRWLRNLVSHPPPIVGRAARPLMSPATRAKVARSLSDLNRKETPGEKMDPSTRRALAAEFAAEVESLGHLIDRDLSHWTLRDSESI